MEAQGRRARRCLALVEKAAAVLECAALVAAGAHESARFLEEAAEEEAVVHESARSLAVAAAAVVVRGSAHSRVAAAPGSERRLGCRVAAARRWMQ